MASHSFLPLRQLRPSGDPFALRVTQIAEGNPRGTHILYHARSARRTRSNLALRFAESFGLPVVVCFDGSHLSARQRLYPSPGLRPPSPRSAGGGPMEPSPRVRGEGARRADEGYVAGARYVIADEFPTLPIPPDTTHLFDGNGILPMRALEKEQYSAKFFRDRAFRLFEQFWIAMPPAAVDLSFLPGYAKLHSKSPRHTSGLSTAIHLGQLGVHELVAAVLQSDAPEEDVDAFLEQLIIRRELAFNLCFFNKQYDSLEALPPWAKATLDKHRADRRKPCYSFEELERAETHDDVWNLAQRQLLATGTMHGYLRMLWGKKIIEWSATPEDAHRAMLRLYDEYALDGLDPNTYAGILWCFGKHDRPWAPERPIFGTIRWMSSEQTAKKVRLAEVTEVVSPVD